MKPEIVQRNETVTLVYEVPGITLTMRGKAIEGGAEGDVISRAQRAIQAHRARRRHRARPRRHLDRLAAARRQPRRRRNRNQAVTDSRRTPE